jgi:hypothetical protein
MKKLLIAIPAYGGMMTVYTALSLMKGVEHFKKTHPDVGCDVLAKANESLIQRGRNDFASRALRRDYDKMLFIDADLGFRPEWIARLWDHDVPVAAGTYPMKALPVRLNLNVFPEHQRLLGKKPHVQMSDLVILKKELAQENLIRVLHAPTGFLMIDKKTLDALSQKVPSYDKGKTFEFFPVRVNPSYGILESEDWGFCRLCGENGIDVLFDPDIVCSHIGTFNFDPGLGSA